MQSKTDAEGGEVTSEQLWTVFQDEYLPAADPEHKWGRFELLSTRSASELTGSVELDVKLRVDEREVAATGTGNGPIAAFLAILAEQGYEIELYDYVEHTLSAGGDAQAAAYVELDVNGIRLWGVGIDGDISTASLKAVVSSVNRAIRAGAPSRELTTTV